MRTVKMYGILDDLIIVENVIVATSSIRSEASLWLPDPVTIDERGVATFDTWDGKIWRFWIGEIDEGLYVEAMFDDFGTWSFRVMMINENHVDWPVRISKAHEHSLMLEVDVPNHQARVHLSGEED